MDLSDYKAKPHKTLREHTDDLLNSLKVLNDLNYITDQKIYELTKYACEYHDYGKANREFQKRIENNTKFNENIEIAHNVLSPYFIDKKLFGEIDDYYSICFAVLNHHNYVDNIRMLQDLEAKVLIDDLLKEFDTYKISRRVSNKIASMVNDRSSILIKGFLHKCDYSASGEITIEYKNDFLNNGLNKLLDNWRKSNVNANWNELQKFCIDNTEKNIVVVAQTGMGKTEAGLHWIGDNKGFFILPLKTAINSIYNRVKTDILNNTDIEVKLALLHSDALSYYNNDIGNEMDIMDYYNQSKQLSIPLNISTLDQIFDFVFKYQGYELKLATLSYSKIVIDEIQMYGADLLAYLIYGIKMINKLGGSIAILTATLAPFIKDLLSTGEDSIKFEEATFINDIKRHNIRNYNSQLNAEDVYVKYIENKEKNISNKILVVCNTVKKAQQIFNELSKKEEMFAENLNLLHSKFTKIDRASKEKMIFEFGKTEYIGEGIWIATQVVEASLDIDFDYLFTELSDISGLFQRLGRCNRKGTKDVIEANCFVFLDIDKNLLTNGDKGFIDKKIYELSKKALSSVNGLLLESEKLDIINQYLTTDNLKGSDYLLKYNLFYNNIKNLEPYEKEKRDISLRNIVSYDVIPIEVYEKHKEEIDYNSMELQKGVSSSIEKLELQDCKLYKMQLKEDIRRYTVPVGIYDVYPPKKNIVIQRIILNKYEFINVVNCKYNELGFVRLSNKEIENNFDNFL